MPAQIGSLFVSLTADIKPYATEMARASSVTQRAATDIRRSVGLTEQSVGRLRSSMGGNFRPGGLLTASRAFEGLADRANLLRATLLSTTAIFGGFTAALTSNIVLRYADSFTSLSNQIRVVSDDTIDLISQQRALTNAANDSRAGLSATATLYARIRRAAPDESREDTLGYVSTIQRALQLGGATAQETASAMLQLSQGLMSNRLGGEELRAVLETPLGNELAKGLGVSIGRFREMGHAGELTTRVILDALGRIAPSVNEQFSRTRRTLDQALVVADNNLMTYIGSVNEAYDFTGNLGDAIVYLSENLDLLGGIVGNVGLALGALFAGRLLSAGPRRVESAFASIGAQARAARDQVEQLTTERGRAESRLVDAGIRRTTAARAAPDQFADPSAIAAYERSAERLRSLDRERLALLAQRRGLYTDLASVEVRTSARLAAAEQRVAKSQDAIVAALSRREQAQARLNQTQRLGLPRYANAAAAEITAIDREVLAEQQRIATEQVRISQFTTDAERKASDERIEIRRRLIEADRGVGRLELAASAAAADTRSARSDVLQSGTRNRFVEVTDASRAFTAVQQDLDQVTTSLGAAERAASRTGIAMNVLRTAGNGILGVFGGPWGLAFTAGIGLLGYFISESARAAQQTETFVRELEELGLIAPRAIGSATESLATLSAEAARLRANTATDEQEGFGEQLEDVAASARSLASAYSAIENSPGTPRFNTVQAARELEELKDLIVANGITFEQLESRLDTLSAVEIFGEDDQQAVDEMIAALRSVGELWLAAGEAAEIYSRRAEEAEESTSQRLDIPAPSWLEDARAGANPFALEEFLVRYREEMTRTAREARVFAEAERLMADEAFVAAGGTRELAMELAEAKIAQDEATSSVDRFGQSLSRSKGSVDAYAEAIRGLQGTMPDMAGQLEHARKIEEIWEQYNAAVAAANRPQEVDYAEQLRDRALAMEAARLAQEENGDVPLPRGRPMDLPGEPLGNALTEYEQQIDAIRERTNALQVESNVVGLSTYAAEKFRIQTELQNAAARDAIGLTPTRIAQIEQEASAYALATAALEDKKLAEEEARETTEALREASRDILGGFIDDLRQGKSFVEALTNALNRLADRLLDLALDNIVEMLFPSGGKAGGPGNFIQQALGAVFGGVASSSRSSASRSVDDDVAAAGVAAAQHVAGTVTSTGMAAARTTATDVQGQVWNFFADRGLPSHQIAGIMGHVRAESGFNPTAVGDGGNALGLFQWNDRAPALLQAIGGRENLGDVQKQLQFAWSEMQSSEARAFGNLRAAPDVRSATSAFMGFERPAGFTWQNPEGGHNFSGRLEGAEEALQTFSEGTDSAADKLTNLGSGFLNVKELSGGLGQSIKRAGEGLTGLGSGLEKFGQTLSTIKPDGGGGGGGLFDLIGGLFGFGGAGKVPLIGGTPKFASGGLLDGIGSGRSDSNVARFSKGEFLVNAAATKKHRGLLEALNDNRLPIGPSWTPGSAANENHNLLSGWDLPKFANGGIARSPSIFGDAGAEAAVPLPDGRRIPVDLKMPAIPRMRMSGGEIPSGRSSTSIEIVNRGRPATVESAREEEDADGNRKMIIAIKDLIADEVTRPGSKANRGLQAAFGLKRQGRTRGG